MSQPNTDADLAFLAARILRKHLPWDEYPEFARTGGVADQLEKEIAAALQQVRDEAVKAALKEIARLSEERASATQTISRLTEQVEKLRAELTEARWSGRRKQNESPR